MKNYLKIKSLFFFLILISIFSCSKDDADSNSNNGEVRYLSSLTASYGDQTYPRYAGKDTLVYENGKVIKSLLSSGCGRFEANQYEYGSNGKVSKIYRAAIEHADYPLPEDVVVFFENSSIIEYDTNPQILSYDSENRLVKKTGGLEHIDYQYDDQGRLYKIIDISGYVFTVREFDDKGNPLLINFNYMDDNVYDIVYTYENLRNPYYDLFQKYGLDNMQCFEDVLLIAPNVTSSEGDRNYSYFSDGEYPSSVQFYRGGSLLTFDFTYR